MRLRQLDAAAARPINATTQSTVAMQLVIVEGRQIQRAAAASTSRGQKAFFRTKKIGPFFPFSDWNLDRLPLAAAARCFVRTFRDTIAVQLVSWCGQLAQRAAAASAHYKNGCRISIFFPRIGCGEGRCYIAAAAVYGRT